MKIIALETSSDACSIALLNNDKISQKHQVLPQQHAAKSLTWVSQLLEDAGITLTEIDAIAYSSGPGSFTGIRIGAAIAQAFALAKDKPLLAIPSLQVIAQGAYREFGSQQVRIILDARMGQVYLGCYVLGSEGIMINECSDSLSTIEQIDFSLINFTGLLVANAVENYHPVAITQMVTNYYPKAQDVLIIAEHLFKKGVVMTFEEALPIYLRNENIWKKINE